MLHKFRSYNVKNTQVDFCNSGPTNIPERILNDTPYHQGIRETEIPNLTIPLYKDVKKVFKSEKGTIFLSGSGTGAWESAIINTMSLMKKF